MNLNWLLSRVDSDKFKYAIKRTSSIFLKTSFILSLLCNCSSIIVNSRSSIHLILIIEHFWASLKSALARHITAWLLREIARAINYSSCWLLLWIPRRCNKFGSIERDIPLSFNRQMFYYIWYSKSGSKVNINGKCRQINDAIFTISYA